MVRVGVLRIDLRKEFNWHLRTSLRRSGRRSLRSRTDRRPSQPRLQLGPALGRS
ncbi:hypothetical protein HWB30_gp55 [Pseudomonas phage BrSP1]|uniref:Uncharacterized protein n=1 Tax=Pseudomonas phage BrSP1 TaxID=2029635 RepID=A0A343KK22_9CAUD|nr:hypothetical protein HWB30_gp55 [Pseudomonas phage BrSP1]ATI16285.1 hypothetical protein BrSP1_55 [Pseudomonas phage BrSP1]